MSNSQWCVLSKVDEVVTGTFNSTEAAEQWIKEDSDDCALEQSDYSVMPFYAVDDDEMDVDDED